MSRDCTSPPNPGTYNPIHLSSWHCTYAIHPNMGQYTAILSTLIHPKGCFKKYIPHFPKHSPGRWSPHVSVHWFDLVFLLRLLVPRQLFVPSIHTSNTYLPFPPSACHLYRVAGVGGLSETTKYFFRPFGERVFANFHNNFVLFTIAWKQAVFGCNHAVWGQSYVGPYRIV